MFNTNEWMNLYLFGVSMSVESPGHLEPRRLRYFLAVWSIEGFKNLMPTVEMGVIWRISGDERTLSRRPAAVDQQYGTGHEAGGPGGQEHCGTDDLPRLPEPFLRNPPEDRLVPVLVFHDLTDERRGEVRRGQGVHLDVVRRELQREHPSELHNGPLTRGVGALALHGDEAEDGGHVRSEEHTSELQSRQYLVCRL